MGLIGVAGMSYISVNPNAQVLLETPMTSSSKGEAIVLSGGIVKVKVTVCEKCRDWLNRWHGGERIIE
jgi:hypothetical protein